MPTTKIRVGAPGAPALPDNRARRRHRVLLAGVVCFGPDVIADCTIRDLSELGARLHIPEVLGLPPELSVVVMQEGVVFRARRVWAKAPLFGVEFLEAENLERTTKPAYAALRRTWHAWAEKSRG